MRQAAQLDFQMEGYEANPHPIERVRPMIWLLGTRLKRSRAASHLARLALAPRIHRR